jgi:transcriptional regulator with XRE-family HTH domain
MQTTQLKLARVARGVLQVDIARRARIDRSRLSQLENGWLEPRDEELQRLAVALGVPVEQLRAAKRPAAA